MQVIHSHLVQLTESPGTVLKDNDYYSPDKSQSEANY